MSWIRKKLRGLRRRLSDGYFERRFGVKTMGLRPQPVEDGHWYVTTPYRSIFRLLAAAQITSRDVLFDLGCGKGRILLAATRSPAKKIVGVELNPELAAMATAYLAKQRLPAGRAEVRNQNVLDVDYADATVLVLFDPFGAQTLRGVLERLKESLVQNPRTVRLVFILAVAPENVEVLRSCGWLQCVQQFSVPSMGADEFEVTIWSSTPTASQADAATRVTDGANIA